MTLKFGIILVENQLGENVKRLVTNSTLLKLMRTVDETESDLDLCSLMIEIEPVDTMDGIDVYELKLQPQKRVSKKMYNRFLGYKEALLDAILNYSSPFVEIVLIDGYIQNKLE